MINGELNIKIISKNGEEKGNQTKSDFYIIYLKEMKKEKSEGMTKEEKIIECFKIEMESLISKYCMDKVCQKPANELAELFMGLISICAK